MYTLVGNRLCDLSYIAKENSGSQMKIKLVVMVSASMHLTLS